MEKLEIMIMLASEKNIEQVLNEFKEAASEVDVEFVRKSVRAIGRCAIKIEKAAERCIQVLLELIQTKVNYVVQEAVIVIKDIFRKYPNKYESIIATLCENLDTLDEPEAKASMIWIIGEYAERIENADELLASFLENFHDENSQVQLQLVTAIVKLFLKRPKDTQEMVQKVLNLATQETDNPDLRDRGYVYWRLLSTDPEAAKSVVLSEKPLISDSSTRLDDSLLEELIKNISTLASVYHKPPEVFVSQIKEVNKEKKIKKDKVKENDESLLPHDEEELTESRPPTKSGNIFDLDTIDQSLPNPNITSNDTQNKSVNLLDELDFFSTPSIPQQQITIPKEIVLTAEKGKGMQISSSYSKKNGQPSVDFTIFNQSTLPLSDFAIQFNKNSFGIAPTPLQVTSIMPGQSVETSLLLVQNPNLLNSSLPLNNIIQVAIKNNLGVFYFQLSIPLHILFNEKGQLSREEYIMKWKNIPEEHFKDITNILTFDPNTIQNKLQQYNIFYIASRKLQLQDYLYFSAKINETIFLLELAIGGTGCKLCSKTNNPELIPLLEQSIATILAM
jgi:hypothetical protein